MNIRGRIGRGTGDGSAACSGACRKLARARRSYVSSFDPDWCATRSYICKAHGTQSTMAGRKLHRMSSHGPVAGGSMMYLLQSREPLHAVPPEVGVGAPVGVNI